MSESGEKNSQPLIRACIAATSVLAMSGVGIVLFNRPGTQKFNLSAACQSVHLPKGSPISLGHEYSAIRLSGFTGRIEHIDISSAKTSRVPGGEVLDLNPETANPTNAPPALAITVQKLGGMLSVDAKEYLDLEAEDGSLSLRFGPGSTATLSAGLLRLASSRYKNAVPETVGNSFATVDAKFQVPAGEQRAALQASWNKTRGLVPILDAGATAISGPGGTLSAVGCTGVVIQVSGSDAAVQNGDSGGLVIETGNYRFERIALQLPLDPSATASVKFLVSGDGTSITTDGREVLPSVLKQILDGKPYQLGLFGTMMIFVIFAGGTVLKRAFDVFAKRLIPD